MDGSSETDHPAVVEAEAFMQGLRPPAHAPLPRAAGAEGSEGSGGIGTPSAPSDNSLLAGLIVGLTDHVFNLVFGPGSEMTGAMREETEKAWSAVIDRYLPRLHQAGPVGALAVCYCGHAVALYSSAKTWIPVPSPSSSDNEAAAKQA